MGRTHKRKHTRRRRKSSKKGTRSKTHHGRLNYTTKGGDKVFHRRHHYVHKKRHPYRKRHSRRSRSGGSIMSMIKTAVVPFGLVGLNKVFGKTRKR